MNQHLIAQLRSGEIAAFNNGTLEQLREVLKAAFPEDDGECSDGCFYFRVNQDQWVCSDTKPNFPNFPALPTVPITDFFEPSTEDRAVELLREAKLQIEYLHQKCVVTGKQNSLLSEIEQFLNELNKDK